MSKYTNVLTGLFHRWNVDPVNGFLFDPQGNTYEIN